MFTGGKALLLFKAEMLTSILNYKNFILNALQKINTNNTKVLFNSEKFHKKTLFPFKISQPTNKT